MKKKVVQDVIPPKKSIRNIDLIQRQKAESQNIEPIIIKEPVKDVPKTTKPPTRGFDIPSEPVIDIKKPGQFEKPVDRPVDRFARAIPIRQPDSPIKVADTQPVFTPKPTPPPPPSSIPQYKYEYSVPKKPKRTLKYSLIIISILAVAFGVSTFFRGAEIKVSPKKENAAINESFSAKKDATGSTLGFQFVSITKDVEKSLSASTPTTEQKVDKKATGKIIIYNNFSDKPQKLVATTRFETAEGLVYRLPDAVTVPGNTVKDGKTVAGSLEVTVEADKPGAIYNIGLKDFTLPGLKGDPKYSSVYARSKTEMTGGFSGMQKTVSKDMLSQSDTELEGLLKNSLSNDVTTQIPSDYVLYKESLSYKFEPTNDVSLASGSASSTGVVLKKRGTATGIIFEKGALTRAILSKISPNRDNSQIKITNLDTLSFAYSTSSSAVGSVINFSLNGNANLVWTFDENKLKTDLLGLSKNSAKSVLASYNGIDEAWVLTKPFWNQKIPNDPSKVTLINTLTQ
jgi:hypothetical protein